MAKKTMYSAYKLTQSDSFRSNVSAQAATGSISGTTIFAKSTTNEKYAFCTAKNKQPKITNNNTKLSFGTHECAIKIGTRYKYESARSFDLARLPDRDTPYTATTPTCKITLRGSLSSNPCWATVSNMYCEVFAPFSYEIDDGTGETTPETENQGANGGDSSQTTGGSDSKSESSGGESENTGGTSGSTTPPTNPQSSYFKLKDIAMFVKINDNYLATKSLKVEDKKIIVTDYDGSTHEKISTKSANALHSAICQALRHSGNILDIDRIA